SRDREPLLERFSGGEAVSATAFVRGFFEVCSRKGRFSEVYPKVTRTTLEQHYPKTTRILPVLSITSSLLKIKNLVPLNKNIAFFLPLVLWTASAIPTVATASLTWPIPS